MSNENKLASKHTPGPWIVKKEIYFGSCECRICDHRQINLAIVESNIMDKDTIEANAHLISAAPDAIELIADLLEAIDKEMFIVPQELTEVIKRAEAILKKAYNF